MTPEAAQLQFWSGFGIPAYIADSVDRNQKKPYLTYEVSNGEYGDLPRSIAVQIWYQTNSEKEPNDKVREISNKIGRGGCMVSCDGGGLWITKGSPFCLYITDPTDHTLKLRQLNINIEHIC